jgi:hypothetical protein
MQQGMTAYTGRRELLWLKAFEIMLALKVAESCKSEAIQDSVRGFSFLVMLFCSSIFFLLESGALGGD